MDTAYELSKALPNKWLNPDGSITDFKGTIISPANPGLVEVYKTSRAIVNKFTDKDGETKTYDQISMDIFVTVSELPKYGEKNKIYLVPAEDGMFDEYFWNENNKWDKIGEVKVDLSNYYNRQEVDEIVSSSVWNLDQELTEQIDDARINAVGQATSEARDYTDEAIKINITNVLGGEF